MGANYNDLSFLPNYLPAVPPMYGVRQETPASPQGLDLYIPLDFSDSGITDFSPYLLEAIIKEDELSDGVVWLGHITDGGIVSKTVSSVTTYYAYISLAEAATIRAGLYYLAVTAEVNGDNAAIPISNKILLYKTLVNLRNTAASINLNRNNCPVAFTLTDNSNTPMNNPAPQVIVGNYVNPNGHVTPQYPSAPAMYYQDSETMTNLWVWSVANQVWVQFLV